MALMKSRTFECPDCGGQFTVLMEDTDPFPSFCQCCGASMTSDPIMLPSSFRVGNWKHSVQDKVYRDMESSSAQRAKDAADMLGVPESEMYDIKITDMRDNLREGDVAAKMPMPTMPNAPITQMSNAQALAREAGAATAKMAMTAGPEAGPHGNRQREKIIRDHGKRQAIAQRLGQQGQFRG